MKVILLLIIFLVLTGCSSGPDPGHPEAADTLSFERNESVSESLGSIEEGETSGVEGELFPQEPRPLFSN